MLFSITIPDAETLRYFYLERVINGGLFIPTTRLASYPGSTTVHSTTSHFSNTHSNSILSSNADSSNSHSSNSLSGSPHSSNSLSSNPQSSNSLFSKSQSINPQSSNRQLITPDSSSRVPTSKQPIFSLPALGDELFAVLNLPNGSAAVIGRVVWVTPKNSAADRPAGIGFQFVDASEGLAEILREALSAPTEQADESDRQKRPGVTL
ncbi:MAG: PilZ domain-containing protein [Pseudomonadales bacterium]|nr:PilZ domain-containing protein [Pseudomonadales bacterium]